MNVIKVGTKSLKNVFIGDRQVSRIYKGAIKVFDCIRQILSFSQTITVPNDVSENAKITMLGGMSRKGRNVCNFNIAKKIEGNKNFGVSSIVDETHISATNITSTSTNTRYYVYLFNLKNGEYTVNVKPNNDIVKFNIARYNKNGTTLQDRLYRYDESTVTFTVNDSYDYGIEVRTPISTEGAIQLGTTIFELMLNEGSTAHDFEPYTEELIDAKVDEVVSVGTNKFNANDFVYYSDKPGVIREIKDGGLYVETPNPSAGAYGGKIPYDLEVGKRYMVIFDNVYGLERGVMRITAPYTSETYPDSLANIVVTTKKQYLFSFTATNKEIGIYLKVNDTSNTSNTKAHFANIKIMDYDLYMNEKVHVYTPYFKHTKPLPPQITEKLIGINTDCYNYVDFERKVLVERVGTVDLGTLVWRNLSTVGKSTPSLQSVIKKVRIDSGGRYEVANAISNKYSVVSRSDTSTLNALSVQSDGIIIARFGELQTIPSGILYYELETPIITDIGDLLEPNFNLLQVESGGTISFNYNNVENYIVDVPSEIEFKNK